MIIDGHSVVEVATKLGLETVPCIVVDHLTREERRLLTITLNRTAELGGWDLEMMQLEFNELIVLDMNLDATGFTAPEIDQIILGSPDDGDEPEQGPLAPEDHVPGITQDGDLWQLGEHRIYCGDSKAAASYQILLGGTAIQLVLTDFPIIPVLKPF